MGLLSSLGASHCRMMPGASAQRFSFASAGQARGEISCRARRRFSRARATADIEPRRLPSLQRARLADGVASRAFRPCSCWRLRHVVWPSLRRKFLAEEDSADTGVFASARCAARNFTPDKRNMLCFRDSLYLARLQLGRASRPLVTSRSKVAERYTTHYHCMHVLDICCKLARQIKDVLHLKRCFRYF